MDSWANWVVLIKLNQSESMYPKNTRDNKTSFPPTVRSLLNKWNLAARYNQGANSLVSNREIALINIL